MSQSIRSFRRFLSNDIPEILRIQEANLVSNLSDSEMVNGFLSVEFLPKEFEEMNSEIACIVADLGDKLGGYLCGSSLEFNARFPILAHMINLFPETSFISRTLDQYRSFIYGPVCIEKHLRGSGIIEGLFNELLHQVSGNFDIGATFISRDNTRSLRAHTGKLKMEKIRDFEFNGNVFFMLVFEVPFHS